MLIVHPDPQRVLQSRTCQLVKPTGAPFGSSTYQQLPSHLFCYGSFTCNGRDWAVHLPTFRSIGTVMRQRFPDFDYHGALALVLLPRRLHRQSEDRTVYYRPNRRDASLRDLFIPRQFVATGYGAAEPRQLLDEFAPPDPASANGLAHELVRQHIRPRRVVAQRPRWFDHTQVISIETEPHQEEITTEAVGRYLFSRLGWPLDGFGVEAA